MYLRGGRGWRPAVVCGWDGFVVYFRSSNKYTANVNTAKPTKKRSVRVACVRFVPNIKVMEEAHEWIYLHIYHDFVAVSLGHRRKNLPIFKVQQTIWASGKRRLFCAVAYHCSYRSLKQKAKQKNVLEWMRVGVYIWINSGVMQTKTFELAASMTKKQWPWPQRCTVPVNSESFVFILNCWKLAYFWSWEGGLLFSRRTSRLRIPKKRSRPIRFINL